MKKNNLLIDKMGSYTKIEGDKVYATKIAISLSFIEVRDVLIEIADILEEDYQQQIFIAIVKAGFANMNPAILGISVEESNLHIVSYAKEGLIKQNTAEKAVERVLQYLR